MLTSRLASVWLAGAFVVVALLVSSGKLAWLDMGMARLTELPEGSTGHAIAEALVEAGSLGFAVVAALVGVGLAVGRREASWLVLGAPLLTIPVDLLAKNVVPQIPGHAMTSLQLGSILAVPAPFSFPSGNMARVTAFGLGLLMHPAVARKVCAGPKFAFSLAAIVVVAWGHLASATHWTSDLVGGVLLGAAAALALSSIVAPDQPDALSGAITSRPDDLRTWRHN